MRKKRPLAVGFALLVPVQGMIDQAIAIGFRPSQGAMQLVVLSPGKRACDACMHGSRIAAAKPASSTNSQWDVDMRTSSAPHLGSRVTAAHLMQLKAFRLHHECV